MPKLCLAQIPEADKLLSEQPLALVIGMVLDQQFPLERAFAGPYVLTQRLKVKKLSAKSVANMDSEKLIAAFSEVPAIHRFPKSMAERVQSCCEMIVADFEGDAETIWTGATDAKDLFKRVKSLPGFGDQKAKIFIALLGKQYGLKVKDWQSVCEPYGEKGSTRSVADITSKKSLEAVREWKKAAKAAK